MQLRCPRDNSQMVIREAEGHFGHVCAECKGAWLAGSLVGTLQFSASYPADLFLKELKAGRYQRSLQACPEGCDYLVRTRTSVASMDTCNRCSGVWFSREELIATLSGVPDEPKLPRAAQEAGAMAADFSVTALIAALLS